MCAKQSQLLEEYKSSVVAFQLSVSQLTLARGADEYLQRARKAEQFRNQCVQCRESLETHQIEHRCVPFPVRSFRFKDFKIQTDPLPGKQQLAR